MRLVFSLLAFIFLVQGNDEKKCNTRTIHYKEIGCKPFYKNVKDNCPLYYDCSHLKKRAKDKCYFAGNVYNVNDIVDAKLTTASCRAGCVCYKQDSRDFICAVIDCVEYFDDSPLKPGCYRVYEHASCCSVGTICPPFTKKLAKCKVNDKIYREGQRFIVPKNEHLTCICKPNFNGKLVEPFCVPRSCDIELFDAENIRNKCAPVYYGNNTCPTSWKCFQTSDTIIKSDMKPRTRKKCFYGKEKLSVGDKIIFLKHEPNQPLRNIECKCVIPPLVSCVENPTDFVN